MALWGEGGVVQGAMVCNHDSPFDGMQECLFLVDDKCFTRHGLHKVGKYFISVQYTGFVNGFALIGWDDNPNKLYWVPKHCIEKLSAVEETNDVLLGRTVSCLVHMMWPESLYALSQHSPGAPYSTINTFRAISSEI